MQSGGYVIEEQTHRIWFTTPLTVIAIFNQHVKEEEACLLTMKDISVWISDFMSF